MKNNVLVIGGLGFIGHHLVAQLQDDFSCTIVDNCAEYTPKSVYKKRRAYVNNVDVINMDIVNVKPSDFEPDYDTVIHLGSYPNIKEIEANPSLGISSLTHGVFHSIELARSLGAKRFIYSSSSMVYGDFEQDPCPEHHPKNPRSIYGIYKKAAEELVKSRCMQYNIEYTIIRPIAVYGPGDNEKRVVSKFFKLAIAGAELPVRGDTRLDATYVMDTVQGFVRAVKSENSNIIVNISSGESVSLYEIAQHIIELVGNGSIKQLPADPLYPTRGALDISQAQKYLNFQPKYNIKKGLEEYDSFYRLTKSIQSS